jgi:hypothetical protein
MAHDHMIQNFDLKQLARANEIARNFYVGLGRLRFAAWMIVHDNDRACGCDDSNSENLAGVNKDRIESPNRDKVMNCG